MFQNKSVLFSTPRALRIGILPDQTNETVFSKDLSGKEVHCHNRATRKISISHDGFELNKKKIEIPNSAKGKMNKPTIFG